MPHQRREIRGRRYTPIQNKVDTVPLRDLFVTQKEDVGMDFATRMYVKAREWHKGQTMTEYALILSAVAVVVFIGYQTMGTQIQTLLNSVDSQL